MTRHFWHDEHTRLFCFRMTNHFRHDSHECATWLTVTHSFAIWRTHTCDMTHTYVRRDPHIRATWPTHTCDVTHTYVRSDSTSQILSSYYRQEWEHVVMTHHIRTCHPFNPHFSHDKLCLTWLTHTCDITHRDAFLFQMTHSYVRHDSSCRMWSRHCMKSLLWASTRGGGLGSSTIFKKFDEPYAPS